MKKQNKKTEEQEKEIKTEKIIKDHLFEEQKRLHPEIYDTKNGGN